MFTGYQSTEELTQNLIDAGCDEEMISVLLSCLSNGNQAECLCLLEKRREEILRGIHKEQANIEYLDELLVSLRRKNY